MKTIMLATDFSERSDRALRRAVLLARESEARIDLVHVVDDDLPLRLRDNVTAEAGNLLSELARSLERVNGVSCGTQVIQADPFAGIIEAAEADSPDLLVLGPHRRQILKDAFIGTTAERTIRAAACPVLMVNGPPVGSYTQTLLTTDLSDSAQSSLQHFEQLQMGMSGGLSILHVFDTPVLRAVAMTDTMSKDSQDAYVRELRTQAERELVNRIITINGRRPEPIVRPEKVSVADEILTAASDLNSDLIVVSTLNKSFVARILLGSVTEQVLRSAPVDVLSIPPKAT